jgi:hypothetical protein
LDSFPRLISTSNVRKICVLIFCWSHAIGFSQDVDFKNFDYTEVDEFVLNFPKTRYKSYEQLADDLTQGFQTE